MNENYTVGDYGIFNDAITTTNKLKASIDTAQTTSNEVKSVIDNDAVFMGPCADSCVEAVNTLNSSMTVMTDNFTTINNYLTEIATAYKNGDKEAMNKVLNLDSTTNKLSVGTSASLGNTQATSFNELGDRAYNGDKAAQQEWIEKVAAIVDAAQFEKYGLKNSLIIAQIINESGWMHTPRTKNPDGSTLTGNNNILGINTQMGIDPDTQNSAWSKKRKSTDSNVTQLNSSKTGVVGSRESMRTYDSIEECIEDYADILYTYHPECKGSNNLSDYSSFLEGYTPPPAGRTTTEKYRQIIEKYDLEKYDR